MRIVIIEPRGTKANVFERYMKLPLMGSVYLGTILKNNGYDIKVYNENILGRDITLSELRDADFLILTGITSTIQRSYKIAQKYKEINPDGKVAIGGIHATFMQKEALKYADYVCAGEGEEIILDLIKGKFQKGIIENKEFIPLDNLPTPNFELIQNHKEMNSIPIMTSRGCPFNCNFCSVTCMFGKKYRTRSINNVIKDMQDIKKKNIFIYDDNFCANKKRTHELLDTMKRSDLNFRLSCQLRCDAANDTRLIKKLADNGCVRAYIGFESINENTLKALNKSQTVDNIRNAVKTFHDYGIATHGMFMLGSDEDDKSVFKKTTEFVQEHDIDSLQYMILTPIAGTPLFNDLDQNNRLLHKNWKFYDGMHVVFRPKNFTPAELQQGALDCYNDFYNYTKAVNDVLNILYSRATLRLNSYYLNMRRNLINTGITFVAKGIINNWTKNNNPYLKKLYALQCQEP